MPNSPQFTQLKSMDLLPKVHAVKKFETLMINQSKKRIFMNAFFNSQFNCCSLIWMCHSRSLYHKTNRFHEKCLRIISNDKTSSYEELLSKDGSVCMYHNNLQKLVIEIYKVVSELELCPEIMNEVFQFQIQNHHNLKKQFYFRDSIV